MGGNEESSRAPSGKHQQKEAKRQAREQERVARVQKLELAGLTLDRLQALLQALAAKLERRECDHTHRDLEALLRAAGIDVEAGREALVAEGAGCDCEAIMNIDLDSLMPAPRGEPTAAPQPPEAPRRKQAKAAQPDRWVRGRFALPIPKSPWKVEEAGDTLTLRFGGKNSVDSLRLRLWGAEAKDEQQFCRERWLGHQLAVIDLVHADETASERRKRAEDDWVRYSLTLVGPSGWKSAAVEAREYVAASPTHSVGYTWMFCDGPDGLVLEFGPLEERRAAGDRKEVERVLATLTRD